MSNYTYMVTNKLNGKVYIGSHCWDGEGLDPNYYGSGIAITAAVRKYGKENFQVEVLYYYDTIEECRADEERILTEYDVKNCPHSYNIKNGAIGWTSEDVTGEKHPMYGKHLSAEHRQKLSQAKKGIPKSEEHKKKLSQALRGENNPNYGKRGKGTPMYGKHHTEETRRKISQANKGENNPNYGKHFTLSEEHKKKISENHADMSGEKHPMYGRHHTEETRKKMSKAQKGEKHPMYGRTHTENTRNKIAIANGGKPFVAIKDGKIKIFTSQHECSRVLGLYVQSVNACLKGRQKSTGGYTFKYLEQLDSGIYEGML